jgi:hypothetical protein
MESGQCHDGCGRVDALVISQSAPQTLPILLTSRAVTPASTHGVRHDCAVRWATDRTCGRRVGGRRCKADAQRLEHRKSSWRFRPESLLAEKPAQRQPWIWKSPPPWPWHQIDRWRRPGPHLQTRTPLAANGAIPSVPGSRPTADVELPPRPRPRCGCCTASWPDGGTRIELLMTFLDDGAVRNVRNDPNGPRSRVKRALIRRIPSSRIACGDCPRATHQHLCLLPDTASRHLPIYSSPPERTGRCSEQGELVAFCSYTTRRAQKQ